jgi:hypothetical protein
MRINIGKTWQRKLAQLPESAMGSQHVDITLKGGRVLQNVPVFNGEDCEASEAFDPNEIIDIKLHEK